MNVAAITISDLKVASSRLRSFYLFHYGERYDLCVTRPSSLRGCLAADVLHIQKVVWPRYLAVAFLFRLAGKQVIFDLDDQPEAYGLGLGFLGRVATWLAWASMIAISSRVTTDTPERADYWRRFGVRSISVIPDAIDSEPDAPFPGIEGFQYRGHERIVWVGYESNLPSIQRLIDRLANQSEIQLTVVTGDKAVEQIHGNWPWVRARRWANDVMQAEEFRMSAMVLNHDAGAASLMKSENKFVLAIASGIVPIVSNTPAYARLARALNAERLVFNDITDAPRIARDLDTEWVRLFFPRAREFIRLHYSSEANLRKFVDLIK